MRTFVNAFHDCRITILLALVAVLERAQTKVWNKIVTGYVNVPVMNITKVSIDTDRTEVFFHLEVPQQMAGALFLSPQNPYCELMGSHTP